MSTIINLLPQPLQLSDGRILGARGTENSVREIAELGANERSYLQHGWISVQESNTGGFVAQRGFPMTVVTGSQRVQGDLTVEPLPLPQISVETIDSENGSVGFATYAIAAILDGKELPCLNAFVQDVGGDTNINDVSWTPEGFTEFRIYKSKFGAEWRTLGVTRETHFIDDGSILGTVATPIFVEDSGENLGNFQANVGFFQQLNVQNPIDVKINSLQQQIRELQQVIVKQLTTEQDIVPQMVNPNSTSGSLPANTIVYYCVRSVVDGIESPVLEIPGGNVINRNTGGSTAGFQPIWNLVPNATEYRLYRGKADPDPKLFWKKIASGGADFNTFVDDGSIAGTTLLHGSFLAFKAFANASFHQIKSRKVAFTENVALQSSGDSAGRDVTFTGGRITFPNMNTPDTNQFDANYTDLFGALGLFDFFSNGIRRFRLLAASTAGRFFSWNDAAGGELLGFGVEGNIYRNNVQVLGARQTGFANSTGTANKGAFNADTATPLQTAQRLKAVEDAIFGHGLIGN